LAVAYTFIGGVLSGSLVAWLLVPKFLSVEYLTPIVLAGAGLGLVAGAISARVPR
jgi:hypothetical protein